MVVHKLNGATIDFAPVVVTLKDKYPWRKAWRVAPLLYR